MGKEKLILIVLFILIMGSFIIYHDSSEIIGNSIGINKGNFEKEMMQKPKEGLDNAKPEIPSIPRTTLEDLKLKKLDKAALFQPLIGNLPFFGGGTNPFIYLQLYSDKQGYFIGDNFQLDMSLDNLDGAIIADYYLVVVAPETLGYTIIDHLENLQIPEDLHIPRSEILSFDFTDDFPEGTYTFYVALTDPINDLESENPEVFDWNKLSIEYQEVPSATGWSTRLIVPEGDDSIFPIYRHDLILSGDSVFWVENRELIGGQYIESFYVCNIEENQICEPNDHQFPAGITYEGSPTLHHVRWNGNDYAAWLYQEGANPTEAILFNLYTGESLELTQMTSTPKNSSYNVEGIDIVGNNIFFTERYYEGEILKVTVYSYNIPTSELILLDEYTPNKYSPVPIIRLQAEGKYLIYGALFQDSFYFCDIAGLQHRCGLDPQQVMLEYPLAFTHSYGVNEKGVLLGTANVAGGGSKVMFYDFEESQIREVSPDPIEGKTISFYGMDINNFYYGYGDEVSFPQLSPRSLNYIPISGGSSHHLTDELLTTERISISEGKVVWGVFDPDPILSLNFPIMLTQKI